MVTPHKAQVRQAVANLEIARMLAAHAFVCRRSRIPAAFRYKPIAGNQRSINEVFPRPSAALDPCQLLVRDL